MFRGHNNPRYIELLPRLDRLDAFILLCSGNRVVRGLQYRGYRVARRVLYSGIFAFANRRYRWMFTSDPEHIPLFRGGVIADVDDPRFTTQEAKLLSSPNLLAYIVTAPRTGKTYERMGVRKPWHVIPQGVDMELVSQDGIADVRQRLKEPGEITVGYAAAWLLAFGDRGGDSPLYNVEHLLDLWDAVHNEVPTAKLWLIGGASQAIRSRCRDRKDIRVFGRLERRDLYSYMGNFDIALYPRTDDQGIQAVKVGEYLSLGIPTVSYDLQVTADLKESGGGVLVSSAQDFIDTVVELSANPERRAKLSEAALAAGAKRDWALLGMQYQEILDRYF
ncbi:MAG TPA: glycosyltransferase [Actinomycetota bacterium]|nr:glycosyltransferase [Actinomycetota bacterium]